MNMKMSKVSNEYVQSNVIKINKTLTFKTLFKYEIFSS